MSIVVIGGLGSVVGPILGALWVIGLPAFFPGNDLVPLLTSSIGLLVLLLYFPGGLMQLGYSARDALFGIVERRHGPGARQAAADACRARSQPPAGRRCRAGVPALRATDVTVNFGGIHAVDDVSIEVGAGEIVGLIGTNGAGKAR